MNALGWRGDDRWRQADCAGARWLLHVACWRPRDPDAITTGDHEVAAILLSGTFDLVGGTTAWPARGARRTPFAGRPMAVFLPAHTQFRTTNGHGEILLVAARQPAAREEPQGRAALAHKPLLPLAGSGKAFDPHSGEWRPAETFPTAPESLPPRRFEQLAVGPCTIERVFAPDYKAATLCVDEAVVPAGGQLALAAIPGRLQHDEVLLFVRGEGAVTIAGARQQVRGDAAFVVPTPGGAADVALAAGSVPLFAVLAYAGKPGSGS